MYFISYLPERSDPREMLKAKLKKSLVTLMSVINFTFQVHDA